MKNTFEQKNEDEMKEPSPKEKALQEAEEKFGDFFNQLENTINAYYKTPDMHFTVNPGGWYITLEKGKVAVNADPTFFLEKGYTESEALYATFHEAEHFLDMIKDPDVYTKFFGRIKTIKREDPSYASQLKNLYNCIDDVFVNTAVDSKWTKGEGVKSKLYHKLFPDNILNKNPETEEKQPRFRQFMYSLLRDKMLPDDLSNIDPEVKSALEKAFFRGEGKKNLLDMLTSVDAQGEANFSAEDRYSIIRHKVEPVFKELFEKDREEFGDPEGDGNNGGDGIKGDKNEEPQFPKDPFGEAIDDMDSVDAEDLIDEINKINKEIAEQKKNKLEEALGVSAKDFESYRKDYLDIEKYVNDMTETFKQLINERKHYKRALKKYTKEGKIYSPSKLATTIAEIKAGNLEPETMLKYQDVESIENLPSDIEFSLVCDGSGSMRSGGKDRTQRKLAVLFLESLNRLREEVKKEQRRGENIKLNIKTEVRIFSDDDSPVLPLDNSLTHPDRVQAHKALKNLPSGGNNELATFEELDKQITKEKIHSINKGELRKIIIFLTDGETDTTAIQKKIKAMNDNFSDVGLKNFIIGGIGFDGGQSAKETYKPYGYYADGLSKVPETFTNFLKNILK